MGRLYDLIQEHIDSQPYEVSERQVARKIGVTQTTLTNWRTPKRLVAREHLQAISRVTGTPYLRVLDALLEDIGYISKAPTTSSEEDSAAELGRLVDGLARRESGGDEPPSVVDEKVLRSEEGA